MRITRRQRYVKRVQSNFVTRRFRGCVSCHDHVKREPMHRFRDSDPNGSWWVYLCYRCAPDVASALTYWQDEEDGS